VLQPGNLVICHKPKGDVAAQAPALIFEILSPSTEKKDRVTKFRIYEQEGVHWYCLVNPEHNMAKVYHLKRGKLIKLRDISNETQKFDLTKCCIRFDFSRIWPVNSPR